MSKPTRCPECKRLYRRTHPQNARYWALLHVMSDRIKPGGLAYGVDTWHLWCKSMFLGCNDHSLPSGKVLTIPKSTADLDVAEFGAYMERVEAFAAERDCFLADTEFAA